MKVNTINKLAASALLITLALTSLGGCLPPEVAHAAPTDTPVAAQTINPTNTPSAIPTNTPNPTPTSIPELSYEEEKKIIGYNPSMEEFIAAAISGIYYEGEMTNENGENVKVQRIAFVYLNGISKTKDLGIHVMFNDTMIFKVKDRPSNYNIKQVPGMNVSPVNENLKNAKIIEGFEIDELEEFCKKRGIPFKSTEALDKIIKYIEKYGLQRFIEEPYMMKTKDFLEIYLSLPKEYRIPVAETIIIDNVSPQETTKPTSYRPYTSKDGASSISFPFNGLSQEKVIDKNVPYGYRNDDYYGPGYVVIGINRSNQYAKTKI